MAKDTFSTFPPEIHVLIAKHCENSDLISLCLSSKSMHERCLRILYREVDLQYDPHDLLKPPRTSRTMDSLLAKQRMLVRTLLSHGEYGKYVRFLKGTLYVPGFLDRYLLKKNKISEADLLSAMQSLTQVQSVDLAYQNSNGRIPSIARFPNRLFQSATSVRLLGDMQYDLAKSILFAINPALLRHLCLDRVRDEILDQSHDRIVPGDAGKDGRIIAPGAMSGLLTALTGRCTALRTLDLRRTAEGKNDRHWPIAADEASYLEWASFIRSVQGTVEKFTFEQSEGRTRWFHIPKENLPAFRTIDERFERLLLPAIVSGNWPCLNIMELRGVRGPDGQDGKTTLIAELRAVLSEKTKIVVEEEARTVLDPREPGRWN